MTNGGIQTLSQTSAWEHIRINGNDSLSHWDGRLSGLRSSPFRSLWLPTFKISQIRYRQTDQTIHIYISEPDQWLYSILTSILHCLIWRPGLNQSMRWMATFFFESSNSRDIKSKTPSLLRTSIFHRWQFTDACPFLNQRSRSFRVSAPLQNSQASTLTVVWSIVENTP